MLATFSPNFTAHVTTMFYTFHQTSLGVAAMIDNVHQTLDISEQCKNKLPLKDMTSAIQSKYDIFTQFTNIYHVKIHQVSLRMMTQMPHLH